MQATEGVAQIASLPEEQRALVFAAYRAGLSGAFTVGAVIAAVGFITVLFLPELPLRDATATFRAGDGPTNG